MGNSSDGASSGIDVAGLLGVVFVTLKLCNVIDWSWWYVTLPFWGPLALFLVIVAVMFGAAGIIALVGWAVDRRDRRRWSKRR